MPAVIMPKMGDAMEEGTLLRWIKNEGDTVAAGDPLAEIETDKVTLELTAEEAGTLAKRIAREGESIPVGQPIAMILGEGERLEDGATAAAAPAPPERLQREAAQAAPRPAEGGETTHGAAVVAQEPPAPATPAERRAEPATSTGAGAAERVKVSPLARRIAQEHEIDLHRVQGSGPGGRIVREDVEAFLQQRQAAPSSTPAAPVAPAAAVAATAEVERVPLSRMRATIARRMVESKTTIPHIYVSAEVDMTEALRWRKQLNEAATGEGYKITVNDMIVKACALALTKFPNVNASFMGDHIARHQQINISIAVALKEGLIAPVVRDADQKSLGRISRETADLATRARDGKLQPREFDGGTFTVSNLGPYGVDVFVAIITLPQVAALAVGSAVQKAVVVDGQIAVRDRMTVTVSADHRVIDGAEAAQFIGEVRRLLEQPLALLM